MATSYTTLLGFALPVTGELSGTWGDTVNSSITQLEEDAIAGVATASVASANWTLSTTGSGASNEARKAILIPTGSPGVSRNIVAPSSSKAYIVVNQSNAAVVLKGSATTGVTIATGTTALCAWNGSDFVIVSESLANATGTLGLANGGTGQTSKTAAFDALAPTTTAGDTMYFNGTDVIRLGIGTAGQALIVNSGATAPQWGSAGVTTGKAIAMAMIFGF
jgi:hypothetical protein